MSPTIYLFANGGGGGWVPCLAVAEDGNVLAQHLCSHACYGPHDLGLTSDWKHEQYREHYPDGFELEWVDNPAPGNCAGLDAAMVLNRALGEAADAEQETP